jgi:hypothetical protein
VIDSGCRAVVKCFRLGEKMRRWVLPTFNYKRKEFALSELELVEGKSKDGY